MANKIKTIRQQKGMTQKEFAEAIGVSMQAVYLWERGVVQPGWGSLVLISQKLDVDINELISGRSENA